MREKARSPIIPLEFNEQARGVRKELLIDYENAAIWVVSKEDNTKLINITGRIRDELISIIEGSTHGLTNISYTSITIEGVGTYNIADLLKVILKDHVHATEDTRYPTTALMRFSYDNESVGIIRNQVRVYGFEEASEGYIPMKRDGVIQWIPSNNLPTPDNYTINKFNITTHKVVVVVGADGSIETALVNLNDNPIQAITGIDGNFILNLPKSIDTDYCIIKVKMKIPDDKDIVITWSDNIDWRYQSDSTTPAGLNCVYTFETFDSGATWCGSRITYNNIKGEGDGYITSEEAYSTFCTKKDAIILTSWQYDADEGNGDFDNWDPNSGAIVQGDDTPTVDLSDYATLNYVNALDSDNKDRIGTLEETSHTHDNKEILDQITAPYTEEASQSVSESIAETDDVTVKSTT